MRPRNSSVTCLPCDSDAHLSTEPENGRVHTEGIGAGGRVFGIQLGNGRWNMSTPSFGKRDLRGELLQIPLVQATAGWPHHAHSLTLMGSSNPSRRFDPVSTVSFFLPWLI